MWKWLAKLVRGKPTEVKEQGKPLEHRGVFRTHDADGSDPSQWNANLRKLVAGQIENIRTKAPVIAGRNVAGEVVAMDAADGEPMGIKGGYQLDAPNISFGIVNYFLSQTFIGHQLAGMLATHWLIGKACAMPPADAIRNGYEVTTADGDTIDAPEILKYIKRMDKKFNVKKNCVEYLTHGRIFGIRIMLFKVQSDDKDYYEKPFNPDGIMPGSYRGMVQVDPYWCSPMLDMAATSQPDTIHFYEPTWWIINGKRYHRSHLCIFRDGTVVDIMKPSYLYGGVPLPQKIMERVYCAERTANEGPQLAMTKRTTVYKTDVAQLLAGGQEALDRMAEVTAFRDNYQRNLIGLDDELTELDTSLTDVDAVIMTQYQIVAAVAGCPATKLIGTSPKGFGASGEYEKASYNESLETLRDDAELAIDRHHLILMRSHVIPYAIRHGIAYGGGGTIPEIGISWNALDTPTALERSEINVNKSQTGLNLTQAGAIDGIDERKRVQMDNDSGYAGIEDVERATP